MTLARIALIACASLAAYGQPPAQPTGPTFDVASIKPAPPPANGGRGMIMGMSGGPGSKDPGLYRCNNCNLSMLVTQAYNIKYYQLSVPSSFENERFNISAKVPDGTTKEQFRLMLQNLLAERFKLAIHREQREMQVYDLVVVKGGLKIKEAVEEPAKDADADAPPPVLGGRGGRGPNLDKDGYPIIPKGCKDCIMVVGGGKARLHMEKETMEGFAEMLSDQQDRPVTDATGLKGKYDFDVTFDMERGMGRGGPPPPSGGGVAAASGGDSPLSADSDMGVPLAGAIQSQLGLKLESRKGQAEILVVDHAEKVPTEN